MWNAEMNLWFYSSECPEGYYGKACIHQCLPGFYGEQCTSYCNCSIFQDCHIVLGCVCKVDYTGTNCHEGNTVHF